jgi:diaminopropionate ammonia-lyase
MSLYVNNAPAFGRDLTPDERTVVGRRAPENVRPYLALWGETRCTPLIPLPGLAASLGIGRVFVKNEGMRLGLGSFKALGGAYAVMVLFRRHLERHLGSDVQIADLVTPTARKLAATITVCCATDGNHGKSVAAGARLIGCRSVIFLHAGVSKSRTEALDADRVVRVDGSYDQSVEAAERAARENGWLLVSDTSWPGYEEIPALVTQGYTVLADEAADQISDLGCAAPTHAFLQAGVGGFAAAMAGYFADRFGRGDFRSIVVEPDRAACIHASGRAGKLTRIASETATVMAMLECHTPSLIAWRILEKVACAFMTVTEDDAMAAMRRLAFPTGDEPAVVAGESGAAGLAGLLALGGDDAARNTLGLGPDSRVLLINTETATDPASYEAIVGQSPETIGKAAASPQNSSRKDPAHVQ